MTAASTDADLPTTALALWTVSRMQRYRRVPGWLLLATAGWGAFLGYGFGGTMNIWVLENSMTYPAAVREGDVLTAVAEEEAGSNRMLYYRVTVTKQDTTVAGLFRGTAYKTEKEHGGS